MNKILILTTKGCEACNIAKRNIKDSLYQTTKTIEVEVKDVEESKALIKKYNVIDFPTVLYLVDNRVKYKAIGSYPIPVYLRWIDLYFKN